ncbi:MAG TPA: SGNH/GDSL hydrolase family protein [Ktedonobacterales bacterium]|jgi:lysophospholipase L1-like esterase|nr:SGNH/GDSL hydrolase family protein [Ktedonobacterales bacterium]
MMQKPSGLDVVTIARDRRVQAAIAAIVLIALLGVLISAMRGKATAGVVSVPVRQTIQTMQPSAFGPLVSRGKPVVCSASDALVGGDNSITSGLYGHWSFWGTPDNALPSWCAIHIGAGPSRLMVAWYSDYDEQNAQYVSNGRMPKDYNLSVSANSTNGSDGDWKVVTTVTNNPAHNRESVIPFAGDAWVKMTITKAQDQPTQDTMLVDQIDCWDVSASTKNTVLFEGDSITAMTFDHSTDPETFDLLMHKYDPRLMPSMLDDGMGGWTSDSAVHNIDTWLALNPDVHYWLLEWGTNDAFSLEDPSVYRANMQILINKIKAAGHVPVLAQIPPVINGGANQAQFTQEVEGLNQQVRELTQANHLIPGPDLYTAYGANPAAYIRADGIHPNDAGTKLINNAWYLAMRATLRSNLS